MITLEAVDWRSVWEFLSITGEAIERKGYQDIFLDLSAVEMAYPDAMAALISSRDYYAANDVDFIVTLPKKDVAKRHFKNTNWAHLLAPDDVRPSPILPTLHYPMNRYESAQEQNRIVNEVIDLVLGTTRLSREIVKGLEWSLNEVMDNVLNHAECRHGGLVQVTSSHENRRIEFVVADSGDGILRTLRQGHPHLRNSTQAIGEAIKAGVTRDPEVGQGNGLAGSYRIATASGGTFEINSGDGHLLAFKKEVKKHNRKQHLHGTVVRSVIDLNGASNMSVSQILGFGGPPHHPTDAIELNYECLDKDAFRIAVGDSTVGVGSRQAGALMRNKVANLLSADPHKPVLVDWTGVPLVASSYADEFLGKLFVELGAVMFSTRVRNVGLEPGTRRLIDAAIQQRMGQRERRRLAQAEKKSRQNMPQKTGNRRSKKKNKKK